MKESEFQRDVIKQIESLYPGCIVLKNDANYIQGIPDFTILYKNKWAMLEFKKSKTAKHRPNQEYYVAMLNGMSFAAFIFPENRTEVLNDLARSFEGC